MTIKQKTVGGRKIKTTDPTTRIISGTQRYGKSVHYKAHMSKQCTKARLTCNQIQKPVF